MRIKELRVEIVVPVSDLSKFETEVQKVFKGWVIHPKEKICEGLWEQWIELSPRCCVVLQIIQESSNFICTVRGFTKKAERKVMRLIAHFRQWVVKEQICFLS